MNHVQHINKKRVIHSRQRNKLAYEKGDKKFTTFE